MENINKIKQTTATLAEAQFRKTEITQDEAEKRIEQTRENIKRIVEEVKNKN